MSDGPVVVIGTTPNDGWVCPLCRNVYAPSVTRCPHHGAEPSPTYVNSDGVAVRMCRCGDAWGHATHTGCDGYGNQPNMTFLPYSGSSTTVQMRCFCGRDIHGPEADCDGRRWVIGAGPGWGSA